MRHTVNFQARRYGKTAKVKSFSDWYLGSATEVDGQLLKSTGASTMLGVQYNAHYKTYSFFSRELDGGSFLDFSLTITQAFEAYRGIRA